MPEPSALKLKPGLRKSIKLKPENQATGARHLLFKVPRTDQLCSIRIHRSFGFQRFGAKQVFLVLLLLLVLGLGSGRKLWSFKSSTMFRVWGSRAINVRSISGI